MCVLSIKVPIQKKSGNLFNDPRIYIYIYISFQLFDNFRTHTQIIHLIWEIYFAYIHIYFSNN